MTEERMASKRTYASSRIGLRSYQQKRLITGVLMEEAQYSRWKNSRISGFRIRQGIERLALSDGVLDDCWNTRNMIAALRCRSLQSAELM